MMPFHSEVDLKMTNNTMLRRFLITQNTPEEHGLEMETLKSTYISLKPKYFFATTLEYYVHSSNKSE